MSQFIFLTRGMAEATSLDLFLPFPPVSAICSTLSPSLPFSAVLRYHVEVFFDVSSPFKFWSSSSSFASFISPLRPYAALVRLPLFFPCLRHVHPGQPPAMSTFVSHVTFRLFLILPHFTVFSFLFHIDILCTDVCSTTCYFWL